MLFAAKVSHSLQKETFSQVAMDLEWPEPKPPGIRKIAATLMWGVAVAATFLALKTPEIRDLQSTNLSSGGAGAQGIGGKIWTATRKQTITNKATTAYHFDA